jgi:hypothetical protein
MRGQTQSGVWLGSNVRAVVFLLAALICAGTAFPQSAEDQKAQDLIARIKRGEFEPIELSQLAKFAQDGATQAIPVLKEQFPKLEDGLVKGRLAVALIRLGQKDPIYWDYLMTRAEDALKDDAPYPGMFDKQGKVVRQTLSPEFIAWAKAHDLQPEAAAYDLTKPGKYTIQLARAIPKELGGGAAKSNFVAVTITK